MRELYFIHSRGMLLPEGTLFLQAKHFLAASEVGRIVAADALFQSSTDGGVGFAPSNQMRESYACGMLGSKASFPVGKRWPIRTPW